MKNSGRSALVLAAVGLFGACRAEAPRRPEPPGGNAAVVVGECAAPASVGPGRAAAAGRGKPYEIRMASRTLTPEARAPNWRALFEQAARPGRTASRLHVIVQLTDSPNLAARAALEASGVKLLTALSGNAYLAGVDRAVLDGASPPAGVRWAGPLAPADKLALQPGALSASTPAAPPSRTGPTSTAPAPVSLVVKIFPDGDLDAIRAQVAAVGGTILGVAARAHVVTVTVPAGQETALAALDDVRYIEPLPPTAQSESDRARAHVGATVGAIAAGDPTGAGVVVGVFDGQHVNNTHQDFGNRVTQGDPGAFAPDFHATMTAGMIAGSGAASAGQGAGAANRWRGMAPAATLTSYNFANVTAGVNDSITNYLNDVTDAVTNDNIVIGNNSWGDATCTAPLVYGAYVGRAPFLDGVVHGDLGHPVTVVFSVGNERDGTGANNTTACITDTATPFANYGTINHPKAAKNVLTVGAIDSANDAMTTYSSWGPTLDGRLKPEIVASGQHNGTVTAGISDITNPFGMPTGATNQQGYRLPFFPTTNFVYGWFTQTSGAAAIVSGAAALIVDAWRTTFPGRPDPLPSSVRALLVHNARDLDDATTWYNRGPDYASGYGLVQVNDTIASLRRREAIENVVDAGERKRFFLTIPPGTTRVKVTLAWDDAPAADGANPALVNDLDLVVTDPNGVRRFPWTLDPANPTAAAVRTGEDHVNNLEQVFLDSGVAAGTWQVEVVGTAVPDGPQTFSVVGDNGPVRRPIDLVMALDTSGSMSDLPPGAGPGALPKIDLLRQAATLVLETWRLHAVPDDRAGILAFNTDVGTAPAGAPVLQPFTPSATALIGAVGGLTASGCTAIGGALQVAFDSFDPTSTNKRVVLLFSDGMQTINPYIGEIGTPSRLQIRDFPAGSTLPFGAFSCQAAPATGPGGIAITPDGRNIDQHDTEIHSIGIGVQGDPFQQLIARVADETHGLHHFTSAPDQNLDLFYTNELVRALKSNTLEIVATDSGTLGAGSLPVKDVPFVVNPTASSITVVLSWRGDLKTQAVQATVFDPSGAPLIPDVVRQQGFFTLLRFDLPGTHGAKPGPWRLRLQRNTNPVVKHQVSILAEEPCFKFDFRIAPGTGAVGGSLKLEGRIDTWGRRPLKPLTVQAILKVPVLSGGKLLSAWVPKTKVWQQVFGDPKAPPTFGDPTAKGAISPMSVLEAALRELQGTGDFLDAAAKYEPVTVTLVDNGDKRAGDAIAGDGRYAALMPALTVAGAYQVGWTVAGSTVCGDITREEQATLTVLPGPVVPAKTPVTIVVAPATKTTAITVQPIDGGGAPMGPGYASRVAITSEGNKPVGGVIDHLDGTYVQTVAGEVKDPGAVKITVDGVTWQPSAATK
jgi:hypothetical protein